MAKQNYTYAVARVRALETSLLSEEDINQLLSLPTEKDIIEHLISKGWGNNEFTSNGENLLNIEHEKTWKVARELLEDISELDVLLYKDLYYNLKSAMKRVASDTIAPEVYINSELISDEELLEIVKEQTWSKLPKHFTEKVGEAYEALLKTGDGQLLDIMLDKLTLEAIYKAGEEADSDIIKKYAERLIAVTDIKVAVRAGKTKKSEEFLRIALVTCKSLNIDLLIEAALGGEETIIEYLETTDYKDGIDYLKTSMSAFECWCDNKIIELIKPELRNSFTIGPVFAYVYARENEIKSVRNILLGKRSNLDIEDIRERVRMMYV